MTNLDDQYRHYVYLITGKTDAGKSPLSQMVSAHGPSAIDIYREDYLKNQILKWGGEIAVLFPKTCGLLTAAGHSLEDFVSFFYSEPVPLDSTNDYFLIKIDRFRKFIQETGTRMELSVKERILPTLTAEYDALREAYFHFNPAD